jgi:hypothetical protein
MYASKQEFRDYVTSSLYGLMSFQQYLLLQAAAAPQPDASDALPLKAPQ